MNNLIVRVKRRRNDAPTDSLCIVEETRYAKKSDIRNVLAKMALSESETSLGDSTVESDVKRLLLQRIDTLGKYTGDRHAIEATRKRGRSGTMESEGNEGNYTSKNQKASVYVTHSRRVVRSKKEGSFVVVDLAQVACSSVNSTASEEGAVKPMKKVDSGAGKFKRAMILSPPDRHLEASLDQLAAMANGTNCSSTAQADFSAVLTAMMQGANVNLQTSEEKEGKSSRGNVTALMLACSFCNLRVASRLLARGADVFLVDSQNDTAMDYLQRTLRQVSGSESTRSEISSSEVNVMRKNAEELAMILQKAAATSQKHRDALRAIADGGASYVSMTSDPFAAINGQQQQQSNGGEGEEDVEFVYDIFTTEGLAVGTGGEGEREDMRKCEEPTSWGVPFVAVQGLRIDEQSGQVEFLEFDYDSDWSDLGDDEDPDSNDERYHGNDYPDEESEEDSEAELARGLERLSEEEDDEEEYTNAGENRRDEGDVENFRGRRAKLGHGRAGRFATGHVSRPLMVGGDGSHGSTVGNEGPRTAASLRRMWEEGASESGPEDEDDEDVVTMRTGGPMTLKEHRDRLRAAHDGGAGLGSMFGSNPREFDSRGLPMSRGYGDEEDDFDAVLETYGYNSSHDHHSSEQFSHFAANDGSDDEEDSDYDERMLYAEARKARAFYSGRDDAAAGNALAPSGTTDDHVWKLRRGVATRDKDDTM